MTTWNIVVAEEYENKTTGEIKTAYHTVGAAWELKKGGFSCKLPKGIGLTGDFLLFPRKDRAADDGVSDEQAADPIPFA